MRLKITGRLYNVRIERYAQMIYIQKDGLRDYEIPSQPSASSKYKIGYR